MDGLTHFGALSEQSGEGGLKVVRPRNNLAEDSWEAKFPLVIKQRPTCPLGRWLPPTEYQATFDTLREHERSAFGARKELICLAFDSRAGNLIKSQSSAQLSARDLSFGGFAAKSRSRIRVLMTASGVLKATYVHTYGCSTSRFTYVHTYV